MAKSRSPSSISRDRASEEAAEARMATSGSVSINSGKALIRYPSQRLGAAPISSAAVIGTGRPTSNFACVQVRTSNCACLRKCCPTFVSAAPDLLRSKSTCPSCCSKVRILMLTVDWVTWTFFAASKKVPVSTTARKVRACSISKDYLFHFSISSENKIRFSTQIFRAIYRV